MIKSNLSFILFFVCILLGITTWYVYHKSQKISQELVTADRGMTIEDFRGVTKIVIKHVKLPSLVFTKNNQSWLVNEKYDVDPAVFVHIEKVLTNIKLLYVPSKNAVPTIMNSIKNNGIQVDIYENDKKPSKIIHIGSDTQDGYGSYIVLGGSNQPFAMQLPGLAGGIRSRFEQPIDNFRDKFIYKYKAKDIDQVLVEYPKRNGYSFKINNTNSGFVLQPLLRNDDSKLAINQVVVNAYMSGFEMLGAEKIMNAYPNKNSILATVPSCVMTIKDIKGNATIYKYYPYDDIENGLRTASTPGEIRFQNRLFVSVDSTDFYTVQNKVFGHIFRSFDEFLAYPK